jgi:two-component system, response regulator
LADAASRTVLLVEDNPTDVFVIQEVIEGCGLNLQLRIASNGEEALLYLQELARTEKTSSLALVLLDLNLPKVSGIDVLRHLREAWPGQHTPVIVVTSSDAEADRAAVERFGAEAYFHKPKNLAAYMQLAPLIQRVLAPDQEGREQ